MDAIPDCISESCGTWISKITGSYDPLQTYRVVNIPKVKEEGSIRSYIYIKQMLSPVLSFKKEDDRSFDCRFISVSLFSMLFEDTLFSVFFKEAIFSIFFEDTSFLNVKVNSEKIVS